MAGIIPKDQLPAFQRWQFNSFDTPAAVPEPAGSTPIQEVSPATETVVEQVTEAPPLPTAEDIERIYEEARTKGYEAGLAEGRESAEQSAHEANQEIVQQMTDLFKGLQAAIGALDQTIAEDLLNLALEVASQVSRGAIKADPDYLLPIIREAIAALPLHHAHIVIHLHPEDAKHVRPHLDELGATPVQIAEDNKMSPGGCLIKAGASEVDASIETRWQRTLEAIGAEPTPWLKTT